MPLGIDKPIERGLTYNLERERKFLVRNVPDLTNLPHKMIRRGYTRISSDGAETRVSQEGNEFFMYTKSGTDMLEGRKEWKHQITYEAFAKNILAARRRVIDKERYLVPYTDPKTGKNHTIELDIFKGKLFGMVMAEVEFDTPEERQKFTPPEWCEVEVTTDSRYLGRRLAVEGLPQDKMIFGLLRDIREKNRKVMPLMDGVAAAVRQIDRSRAELDLYNRNIPIVIGIAGKTASGKSSEVAAKLNHLYTNEIAIISMDDFYKSRQKKLDSPGAFNLERLAEAIRLLKEGETVEMPTHDFNTQLTEFKGKFVGPRRFIVVEGLFTLTSGLKDLFDVRLFVDTGLYGQLIRRVLRDRVQRTGLFTPQQNIRYFLETIVPYQKKYIEPTREAADVVIMNNYNPSIEAKTAGSFENQEKFRTTLSPERLEKIGAQKAKSGIQIDEYYFPDENWRENLGEGIMVRTEGNDTIFVYKGPNTKGERVRFEVPIDQEIRELMSKVFGRPAVVIKKHRIEYSFPLARAKLLVDTDVKRAVNGKAEELGSFVELKFENTDDYGPETRALEFDLGFREQDTVHHPYILM
ncbi:MAG: CYTH domain-containing protein [Candidatus Marsarchaeota archaeon]|nr:CYTH domain-containing protein [Candidatus Marsarchaeota archaeon]